MFPLPNPPEVVTVFLLPSPPEEVTDGDVDGKVFISKYEEKPFVVIDLGAVRRIWGAGVRMPRWRVDHLVSKNIGTMLKVSLLVSFQIRYSRRPRVYRKMVAKLHGWRYSETTPSLTQY